MTTKVHDLVDKEKLTEDDLIEGAIGIEEASAKRVYLYRISTSAADLEKIDAQLEALQIPLSTERTPSVSPTKKPKMMYALNDPTALRVKWNEQHIRTKVDKKNERFDPVPEPKIVVLVVDKKTGLVQIRYDKPGDKHIHEIDGEPKAQAYFDYYREQAENLLGLPLEPIELRTGLEKTLKMVPPVVTVAHVVDEDEEGIQSKRTQKKIGKDLRDTKAWNQMMQDPMVRTYEEAPLRWKHGMTGGKLTREVFSNVDAANGQVRFDAHCSEEEIDYVLAQLV
ncbi:hypothetical protein [Terriglobus roseus]|nr:hypothetical protein [Terriglobus roseus]